MAGSRHMFELGSIGAFSRMRATRELDAGAMRGMLVADDHLAAAAETSFAALRPASLLADGSPDLDFRTASLAENASSGLGVAFAPADALTQAGSPGLGLDGGFGAFFAPAAWSGAGALGAAGMELGAVQAEQSDPALAGGDEAMPALDQLAAPADQGATFSGPDGSVETPQANETFTVTQTTVHAPGGDTDGDGVIDPGETVLTTVTITNNSTNTTATGVTFTETLVGQTLTAGSLNISPIAVNDVFTGVGNTQLLAGGATGLSGPSAVVAGNLLANDYEIAGDQFTGFTVTSVGAFATSGGGTVTINADGSFAYNPLVGFSGADTFSYTITDTGGLTSTATATINITAANTVWYVDAAYDGSNGASNGTSARPFTTLAQVNGAGGAGDVDAASQTIYVRGNHTADFVLESGQSLIGSGSALVVGGYTLAAAGANNTLSHSTGTGVLLSTNNTLSGFNVTGTNNAGTGIADNNGTVGTLTVTNVNVTGSGQAIDIDQGGTLSALFGNVSSAGSASNGIHLQGVSGTFSATGGIIQTATGVGFLIGASGGGTASSGGNANISYGGDLSSNGGATIEIQDRTGGTVTISGAITEGAGPGIIADGNAGTINFTGQVFISSGASDAVVLTNNSAAINFTTSGTGLDITTTTGRGFIADGGGGSVTITGSGNTVSTGSGRAVEIDNVTIGGAGVTFQSVGVADGSSATGIFLNNAGSGGFTITGTGSTAASGGTINSIETGADGNVEQGIGIYINNTNNISLSNMSFTGDFANFGIRGVNVNNFTLRDSTMNGAAGDDGGFGNSNAADEGAISFTQLTGTALFEGNNLSDGHEDVLVIDNSSGTLNLTVRDSANDAAVIGRNGTTTGNDGILVNTSGTASVTALIEGVDFTGSRGDMIQFNASGTATQNITIRNNTLHNTHPDVVSGGGGVSITGGAGTGAGYNVTYRVEGNSMRGAEGTMLFINHLGDAGTVSGSIINNTIGNNNGVHSVVQSETGSNNGGNGIFIGLEHGTGAGNLTHAVRIEGNNIGDIRDGAGIFLRANGDGIAGAGVTRLEATIRGNNIDEMGPNSVSGLYLQVGGAGANDDGLMGLNIENNVIDMTGATNSIAALVFDKLSVNGQYYFPGFGGAYDDATLRSFLIGPEGNTLIHPQGAFAHVITSTVGGTFATGNNFVLTVPAAAAGLNTKEDWEAALRIRQQQALDDHLGALLADEANLVALAEALAARVAPIENGISGGITPIAPTPMAGETISVGPFNLPNGQTVVIQWRATIDAQSNGLIVNPVNQGTITGSGPFPGSTLTNQVTTNLDTLTLGGRVWNDNGAGGGTADNGLRDGTEPGIDGLTVALFVDANNDDVADTPGSPLLTTTTAGGGLYSFAGLAPGNYIVRVTPAAGFVSSTGNVDPDNNVANDDNGGPLTGGFVFSNAITLSYNNEPTAGTGNDTNNTLDFGLLDVNDPPVNTVPGAQNGTEDTNLIFSAGNGNAISVSDPDATVLTVTLTVTKGVLTLSGTTGLTFGAGDGTADATMTFTGTAAAINTALNGLIYRGNTNYNGADTLTILTDDGGQSGSGGPQQDSDTVAISLAAVNDAPVVAGDGTEAAATIVEDTPGAGQTINALFSGQYSDAADNQIPNGGASSPGQFSGIAVVANGSGPGTGQWQYFNGATWVDIGAASEAAAVLLGDPFSTLIRFNPAPNFNGAAPTLTVRLIDNSLGFGIVNGTVVNLSGPGATGGSTAYSTGTVVLSQAVTAVNDGPVNNVPGAQNGTEDTNLVFSTGNGNAISVSDVDASTLTVTLTATNGSLSLSGTAGLSFATGDGSADTTMTFRGTAAAINAALQGMSFRGSLNYNGPASIQIVTSDNGETGTGGTLTDTDTINITLAPDGTIDGDAGNNTLSGTNGIDVFDLSQGGDDNVSGLGGNDGFYFGGAYTSADVVDGGAGTLDQVGLQGDYSGGVTLGSLNGVEQVVLLPGNDTRFGDTAGNLYDYNITSSDASVAAGQRLIIQANTLRAGEDLTFNGSAETDGSFLIYGGQGTDILTGGAGNDGFFFGQGRFGASDVVNGGGGNMDQLGLQGNFNITFGAAHLSSIEFIVLLSASDNRFGADGGTVGYNLTMNDGNVAAGQTMVISATTLRFNETVVFNGSAETNGRFEVYGGGGNDVITGGSGDDLIFGGGRGDTLTGGAGNDIFAYRALTDSNSTERDGIQDFNLGDRIDLSRIDANLNLAGMQGFSFVGTSAFSGTAGELRYENISLGGPIYLIQGDANGDGISDLEIVIVMTDRNVLTTNDFIGVSAAQAGLSPKGAAGDSGGLLIMDLSDPDMLDLGDLGGMLDAPAPKGGHLDMMFARDSGGPDMIQLFDPDLDAASAPDGFGSLGSHDLTL